MERDELRVLTLNCWGLPDCITKAVYRRYNDPKISKGRKWLSRTERIEAIASKLDNYDVVCLQEVWIQQDQETFQNVGAKKGLIYSHVFSSGMIGSSGLQILSRYPIREVYFHRYRVNGQVMRVDHGDYHAGKGFGFARIAVSDTQNVGVIVTHTIASYSAQDPYRPDRLSQVWEVIRFLNLTTPNSDDLFIVAGDMNFRADSVEYNMLTQSGKVCDAFRLVKAGSRGKGGSTIMADLGTNGEPQRIDYIFLKKSKQWDLIDCGIDFNSEEILYSDHFAVTATFRRSGAGAGYPKRSGSAKLKHSLSNSVEDETSEAELTEEKDNSQLGRTALQQSALMIKEGTVVAQQRKTNHLVRSVLSLLVLYVLIVAGASPMFVGGVSVYAVVEFFIAMFVVENEIAALKEAHKEMKYFI